MSRACYFILISAFLLTFHHQRASAQTSIPLPEARAKKVPGAELTIRTLVENSKRKTDTRSSRLIALFVPKGTTPTPLLPAGPFEATWKTSLRLKLRGMRTFSATGRGTLKVQINGETVLEAKGDLSGVTSKVIALGKRNDMVVTYRSPAEGDASVRLYWADKFPPEPIPPTALQHDQNGDPLRLGDRMRLGRELITSRRCFKCHQADTDAWLKSGGMPDLAMDAPSLSDVGARLNEGWIARWIQDPKALRPNATMPRVFADAKTGLDADLDSRARDVAAYLASLGTQANEPAKAKKETIHAGTRLFANLGCIGCHLPPGEDKYEDDDFDRIPLRDVSAKWNPVALHQFLAKPDQNYKWIRMPDFQLTKTEAQSLSAFLTEAEKRTVFTEKLPKGNVARGQKLVQESGCLNCHDLKTTPALKSALTAPAFAKLTKASWSKGCMAEEPIANQKAPAFALEPEDKLALLDVTLNGKDTLGQSTTLEVATRRIRQLRCVACHERDTEPAYWTDLETDLETLLENVPDEKPGKENAQFANVQIRPPLTWPGEKLKPEWMTELFSGELKYKPRPYLRARMPVFPLHAESLAHGLAHQHGYPSKSEIARKPDPELAVIGRELASQRRWNCVGCHNAGEKKAMAAFEAPGVNFQYVRERLQPEYFERWMWAPTRVWPGTKMPTVYFYGKNSQIKNVLEGDSSKQIDALWNYFQLGRDITPPE